MYIPLSILITTFWIFCTILCIYKQQKLVTEEMLPLIVILSVFGGPIFVIGAIIRQVIIEDWK